MRSHNRRLKTLGWSSFPYPAYTGSCTTVGRKPILSRGGVGAPVPRVALAQHRHPAGRASRPARRDRRSRAGAGARQRRANLAECRGGRGPALWHREHAERGRPAHTRGHLGAAHTRCAEDARSRAETVAQRVSQRLEVIAEDAGRRAHRLHERTRRADRRDAEVDIDAAEPVPDTRLVPDVSAVDDDVQDRQRRQPGR